MTQFRFPLKGVQWLLSGILICLSLPIQGQQGYFPNFLGKTSGTYTAASFLRIAPGASYTGRGNTGVATATDALATHWNPAGLAFADQDFGLSATYSPWLRVLNIPDINFFYFSAYKQVSPKITLGLSVRRMDLGDVQLGLPDIFWVNKGRQIASDITGSWRISETLALGISMRHINAEFFWLSRGNDPTFFANNLSGDISLMFRKDIFNKQLPQLPLHFSAGLHISNIGPRMQYTELDTLSDFLPANLSFGWAISLDLGSQNSVTISNDFQKLLVPLTGSLSPLSPIEGMVESFSDAPILDEWNEVIFSLGLEYNIKDKVFIRNGYFHENRDYGNRQFYSFGLGIAIKGIHLDFSYYLPRIINHPLQQTLLFSVNKEFSTRKSKDKSR